LLDRKNPVKPRGNIGSPVLLASVVSNPETKLGLSKERKTLPLPEDFAVYFLQLMKEPVVPDRNSQRHHLAM
jgi:hypothetical protein